MKFFLVLLIVGGSCHAQGSLSFEYDAAGNQKLRELTCVNCNTPSAERHAISDTSKDGGSDAIAPGQISYYPNPVLEQLHIDWTNREGEYLNDIKVYSISGQLIMSKTNLQDRASTDLEFRDKAQGIYTIIFGYSTGDQKNLKIVKK